MLRKTRQNEVKMALKALNALNAQKRVFSMLLGNSLEALSLKCTTLRLQNPQCGEFFN
jgi:hypothetical protein